MKKTGKKIFALLMALVTLMLAVPSAVIAGAEDTVYKVGSVIEYGNYPQTEVKDEALLAELNSLDIEWKTKKAYRFVARDTPEEIDTVKYADVTYNGSKYRVVKNCGDESSNLWNKDRRVAAEYGYTTGPYWFKYEPIKWRVLDPETGYVVSVKAIDGRFFNVTPKENNLPRNDYATSDVRAWLNEDFYNTAFTASQRANVKLTHNENKADQRSIDYYGSSKLAREATDDYVYLPSWYDLTNKAYGYDSSSSAYDPARKDDIATDYARSQGIFSPEDVYPNTSWNYAYYCMLRTHGGTDGRTSWYIEKYGTVIAINNSENTVYSIKPAMTLDKLRSDSAIEDHVHDNKLTSSTEATCLVDGEKVYTCDCGDTYTETIEAPGHDYKSETVTEATCTHDGEVKYTCSACNESYTDVIKRLPHRFENGFCTACGKPIYWDYVVENGEVTVTDYTGDEREVKIPEKIDGDPVTAVASSTFKRNNNIRYVYVPDCVKSIGANAFTDCTALNEVFIGSGMETVSKNAFSRCRSLTVVCILSENCTLSEAFSGNDPRLIVTVPKDSQTEKNATASGYAVNTVSLRQKDGKNVIDFGGKTIMYNISEYRFWPELVRRFPDVYYLYFESITFDGVLADEIDLSNPNIGADGKFLKMEKVYISVTIDGEEITFKRLTELLQGRNIDAFITFETPDSKQTFGQKVKGFITSVFNAISRVVNKIFKIFKKK